ncbi:MAG: amino acid ABC transporter substrate-binding protein [Deltaproteobacteria bacterium]|nr:amino acid ABC transporter substrate-binding protein [Deltaproteobacteria bacterium]
MRKRLFPWLALAALILGIALAAGCVGRDGADQSLEIAKLRGYFVVGLDDAFPPMGFRKQADDKTVHYTINLDKKAVEEIAATDELVGFDIDLARRAAEKLGLKVIFKPVAWDGIIASLNAGDIDMIWNGLSITPERKEQIIFSRPYLDNRQIIMIKSGSGIGGKADLKGKRVGLQLGSTSDTALHAERTIALQIGELKRYPDNRSAMRDLEAGRLDAVIVDEVAGRYHSAKKPGVFAILSDNFGNELYAVGFRKNALSLRNAIDKVLAEMKQDGSADMIAKKWFGAAIIKK